jgi:hypothetical protein
MTLRLQLEHHRGIMILGPVGPSPFLHDFFVWDQFDGLSGGPAIEGTKLSSDFPMFDRL